MGFIAHDNHPPVSSGEGSGGNRPATVRRPWEPANWAALWDRLIDLGYDPQEVLGATSPGIGTLAATEVARWRTLPRRSRQRHLAGLRNLLVVLLGDFTAGKPAG